MIVSKEFMGKLRLYFGLNLYEVRIWTALLSRGVSSAGELSDIANVPRSRSYDILASLESKGFIVQKAGRPLRYEALPPEEVITRVKDFMENSAKKRAEKYDSLKGTDMFSNLTDLYGQGAELIEPHELAGAMRGRENIHHHLNHSVKRTEKNLTLMTTEDGLERKHKLLMPVLEDLKRRGVNVRIAAPVNKNTAEIVRELSKVAEVRHVNEPARFCMIDDREMTFMVNHDDDIHEAYDVAIWAHSPFFSQAFNEMFSLAWDGLKPAKK